MRKTIIKTIAFLMIFTILFNGATLLLRFKPGTEIARYNYHLLHSGLYTENKNSIDVLYIGSSHIFSSISPTDIYKDWGITGYDLSTSCQRIWQSYYFLDEALEYQSPSVVILDTYMIYNDLPQEESYNREAYDSMRWSKSKINAINMSIKDNPDKENWTSYFFPIIRYHNRWKELSKGDFLWFTKSAHLQMKGFLARTGIVPGTFNLDAMSINKETKASVIPDKCVEYLNKINDLCKSKNIKLILTKMPTCDWSSNNFLGINNWAKDNDVTYLDFNVDEELREEVGIDYNLDILDGGSHLNYYGAMKMSSWMGKYLKNNYKFSTNNVDEDKWKADYIYYKQGVNSYEMTQLSDLNSYIDKIVGKDYLTIVLMDKDNYTDMSKINIDSAYNTEVFNTYILNDGNLVYEDHSDSKIQYTDKIAGVKINISNSISKNGNSTYSEVINKVKYMVENDCINIIVWDKQTERIVESVSFKLNENGEIIAKR